jgi:hypothetical protein
MGLGNITFQKLEAHAENYQPSGSTIYRVVWIYNGLQANQTIRMQDSDDDGQNNDLWTKNSGVNIQSGFPCGLDKGANETGNQSAMNGLYISNVYYPELNGASSAGVQMVLTLIEVES